MKVFYLVAAIFVHGNPEPVWVDNIYTFSNQQRCEVHATEFNRRSAINFRGAEMMMAFACDEQQGIAMERNA